MFPLIQSVCQNIADILFKLQIMNQQLSKLLFNLI